MTSFLPPQLQPRQLTPEEQLRQAQQRLQAGAQQPPSYGQGIAQLGAAWGVNHARNRLNEGLPPNQQQPSGLQKIAQALMDNQAPWQFPSAPQAPQQQPPQPWDAQPSDNNPRQWEMPTQGDAPSPQFNFGNLLSGLFGRRGPTGGGLY